MLQIASDTRPGHAENQDALLVIRHPNQPDLLLVAIADGQGGQPGGKAAAQLACKTILQAASQCRPKRLLWKRNWKQLLIHTDQSLRVNVDAGFTTLIAFAVMPNQLCGAANGDSALMAVTPGEIKILSEGQMKNPPVGSGRASAFGFNLALPSPWTILAMTDGVWKFAGWDQIQNKALELHDPNAIIESIRGAAAHILGALQDDFTLLVLRENGETSAK